jgi:hypothetical protein
VKWIAMEATFFPWKQCSNCGADILGTSIECGYCGTPFSSVFDFTEEQKIFLDDYIKKLRSELLRLNFTHLTLFKFLIPFLFLILFFSLGYFLSGGFSFPIYSTILALPILIFNAYWVISSESHSNKAMVQYQKEILIPKITRDLEPLGLNYLYFQEYLYSIMKDEKYASYDRLVNFLYENRA